jgi:hypothetical protein
MPQKKNPDVCELTRGKTGRLVGNLMNLLVALKGLPLTYNRDLQEDKPPLFDSVDTLRLILAVNTEMIAAMELREENCRAAAADPMLLATDLADYLVKKGVPFRHAHELVGKAVAEAIATKTPLDQLDLTAIDPELWHGCEGCLFAGNGPRRPHQSGRAVHHQCHRGNEFWAHAEVEEGVIVARVMSVGYAVDDVLLGVVEEGEKIPLHLLAFGSQIRRNLRRDSFQNIA